VSLPCLIWADPRTGSSALFYALARVIGPPARYEPFQYDGDEPAAWTHVYRDWCRDGDPAALYRVMSQRVLIKHIPEAFDDNFNADLARAAEYHGYRHIRLVRLDTFARLVSRGVAEQLDAWTGPPGGVRELAPIDVPHLTATLRLDAARWRAIVPHLTAALTVKTEDLTSEHAGRRRECLTRILRFLEISREHMGAVEDELSRGDQNTSGVARLVPNLGELREALRAEAVA
jgi:hypothetical protein